jgi:ribosomal protein S18 acetylase RimI-like enzyme
MDLHVRDAVTSDYNEINNLVSEVHSLHVKNRPDVYIDVEPPMLEKDFNDLIYSSDTKIFVVEDVNSKEILAYSIIKVVAPRSIRIIVPIKAVYIEDFCVKSSRQKSGVGKSLFKHIVEYAKSEGASSIQLTVWDFNTGAIKFYEALGMSIRYRRMEINI